MTLLLELGPNKAVLQKWIDPDEIYMLDLDATAFIYVDGKILTSPAAMGTHEDVFEANRSVLASRYAADTSTRVGALRLNDLLGRIGFIEGIPIVSFWNERQGAYKDLIPCLKQLVAERLIDTDCYVSVPIDLTFDGKTYHTLPLASVAQATFGQTNAAMANKAELMRKLHVMPPGEKKEAMRQLGLLSSRPAKTPWQQGAEEIGYVQPGQKWWAATSEDINTIATLLTADADVFNE